MYSSSRSASGSGCSCGVRSQRAARPPAYARRRGQHVAVPAVPAQALHEAFRLRLAVKPARPPFVFVGGRTPGHHEEQHPILADHRDRADPHPGRLHPGERRGPRRGRYVQHVKHRARWGGSRSLPAGPPQARHHGRIGRRLYLPRGRHRVRAGAGQPIRSHEHARPGSIAARLPRWGWAPRHTGQPMAAYWAATRRLGGW